MIDWRTSENWDPSIIEKAARVRRPRSYPGERQRDTVKLLCAFDIETSRVPGREESGLYHWQMKIGLDAPPIHGRTWPELRDVLDDCCQVLKSNDTLVFYVHNLNYEFQFLRTIYDFQPEEVFAVKPRHVVKCTMFDKKIEFRCSYILTQKGLAEWTNDLQVEHPKESSEDYDHNLLRFPWTPLSEKEQTYCYHDVQGLVEALDVQLRMHGDNLATIPLTATGYVRRDMKKAAQLWSRRSMLGMQNDFVVFQLLRFAFRGGDTHANRFYVGTILDNIHCFDRSSSYPDVMINCPFPMSKFKPFKTLTWAEFDRLRALDMAILFRVRFDGLRLKKPTAGHVYLSYSKCERVDGHVLDNGRILRCDTCETALTDVDWTIMQREYVWDRAELLEAYYATYDALPDPLRAVIIGYYEGKTSLKGIVEEMLNYNIAKAKANSSYGCMAQDPVKEDLIFDNWSTNPDDTFKFSDDDLDGKYKRYIKKAFLNYGWAPWVTAWARLRLCELIWACEDAPYGTDYIYCDTDSVFFTGNVDAFLATYNKQRIRDSRTTGAYAKDPKGKIHYMGVFEPDKECKRFITHGAKKYAYEDERGEVHVTVSGVNKSKGSAELSANGGLEAFQPGLVFVDAGGTESVYNDQTRETVEIDGHTWLLGPNIYIRPSTYTLGITKEYDDLLKDPIAYELNAHALKIRNHSPLPGDGNNYSTGG